MCMLFIKPSELTLPSVYVESLWDNNSDGLSTYNVKSKELFQTLDYDEALQHLNDNHDNELIVHFRFGTSGKKSLSQLHGWEILNGKYRFFHNGVLSTFKGNKELSDTQQLIQMFNTFKDCTLDKIISYLETFEQNSRFLIVEIETGKIIKPNCAKWNNPINIDGVSLQFSNSYAIDWYLLQDDGHLQKPFKQPMYDSFYSPFINDQDDFTDAEYDLMMELEFLIQEGTTKELTDFITVNPEVAAFLLKRDLA